MKKQIELLKKNITIKSISRLFHKPKYDKGMHYSKKCYSSFNSKEKLEKIQILLCLDNDNVLRIMP